MFGSMSSEHQIMVLLSLKGGAAYDTQMAAAATETRAFNKALLETAASMNASTRRSFLHNQSLYTLRRYAFYATLGVTGLAFEIGKLGFSYANTIQTAEVALKGFFPTTAALKSTVNDLYRISTFSPFLFKDTLSSFRVMFPAFKGLGITAGTTVRTLQALMNGLAVAGRTSIGSLNRASLQLQHMANVGRPTGQILLALARDGIQVLPALRKELHQTGLSLENIASSGLTAQQVLKAINKYYMTGPFASAAFNQATKTLSGSWRTFLDILSQAAGTSTGGLFSGLQSRLKAVDQYLQPLVQNKKPIGLYNIAEALNHALTPGTDIIINLFRTFTGAINATINTLGILSMIFKYTIGWFFKLANVFGIGGINARILGGAIGVMLALFIAAKIVLLPLILALDAMKLVVETIRGVSAAWAVIQAVLNGEWATARALILGNTIATEANTGAMIAGNIVTAESEARLAELAATYGIDALATEAAIAPTLGFAAALDLLLGPIALVIAGLTAIIIFHKQIARWTGAPTLNPFSHSFWHSSSTRSRRITPAEHAAAHAPRGHHWYDALNPSNWFATGGVMHGGGMAMVGEYGPEMVHLPGGSRVTPLSNRSLAGEGSIVVHVYPQDIYMDTKKVGQALSETVTDKGARMGGRNS